MRTTAKNTPGKRKWLRSRNTYGQRTRNPFLSFIAGIWQAFKLVIILSFSLVVGSILSMTLILGYHFLVHSSYFEVKKVVLKGSSNLEEQEALTLMGLNKPSNLLAVRLGVMAENLKSHSWIKDASLRRQLPGTILVEVQERKPRALIDLGTIYYLDGSGLPIVKVEKDEKVELPLITGFSRVDFLRRSETIKEYMTEIYMFLDVAEARTDRFRLENIAQISFDPVRGLTVFTREQDMEIKVGYGEYQSKFYRLGRVMAHLKVEGTDMNVSYINLECGPRVIIRRSTDT